MHIFRVSSPNIDLGWIRENGSLREREIIKGAHAHISAENHKEAAEKFVLMYYASQGEFDNDGTVFVSVMAEWSGKRTSFDVHVRSVLIAIARERQE